MTPEPIRTTARVLAAAISGKTVVLTGAMVPYKFGSSILVAHWRSQVLPAGVYVAMKGRWFPAGRVAKNRQTGIFEETRIGGAVENQS